MHKHSPTQIHPIEPHQIRSDLLIAGLTWWKRSAGRICRHDERLNELFPSLQICADNGHDWPPPVLCVGPDSDFARLFGSEFVNDMAGTANSVHDSLGYLQVKQSRQPVIEQVKSRPVTVGADKIWLSYERLIVPGSLSSKRELYLVLNKIERVLREVGGAEDQFGF
ncbi:MAG: hypothetical protein GY948_20985 [Alphaproteobacteria bacterium]|nr:hypothetical protein [Alphaproteobacteria bacterium]